MTVIDPADVAVIFPHGLGQLVLLKTPKRCSSCGLSMLLWVDAGEASTCLGCAGTATKNPPQRLTPENT